MALLKNQKKFLHDLDYDSTKILTYNFIRTKPFQTRGKWYASSNYFFRRQSEMLEIQNYINVI